MSEGNAAAATAETTAAPVADSAPSAPANTGADLPETSGSDVLEGAPPAANDNAEPKAQTFKVKVRGEEREVDAEELVQNYQLRRESQKKFEEAKQVEKQARTIIQALEENPVSVITHMGAATVKNVVRELVMSKDSTVQSALNEVFGELNEYQSLPEDQRKQRDRERELERREAELRKLEEQREQERISTETQRFQQAISQAMVADFEAAGVEATPTLLARAAWYLQEQGEDRITREGIADAVKWVADEMGGYRQKAVESTLSDTDKLLEALGDEGKAALKKRLLEEAVASASAPVASNDNAPANRRKPKGRQIRTLEELKAERQRKRWGEG